MVPCPKDLFLDVDFGDEFRIRGVDQMAKNTAVLDREVIDLIDHGLIGVWSPLGVCQQVIFAWVGIELQQAAPRDLVAVNCACCPLQVTNSFIC